LVQIRQFTVFPAGNGVWNKFHDPQVSVFVRARRSDPGDYHHAGLCHAVPQRFQRPVFRVIDERFHRLRIRKSKQDEPAWPPVSFEDLERTAPDEVLPAVLADESRHFGPVSFEGGWILCINIDDQINVRTLDPSSN